MPGWPLIAAVVFTMLPAVPNGASMSPPPHTPQGVGWWGLVGIQLDRGEASMAGKDKGGRSSKTPAAKTAKEKRQAKKDKKSSKDGLLP